MGVFISLTPTLLVAAGWLHLPMAPQPLSLSPPFGLWCLLSVLAPSCGVGDGPTITSCYYFSIRPCSLAHTLIIISL